MMKYPFDAARTVVDALLALDEPSVHARLRSDVLGDDPDDPTVVRARDAIARSTRVRRLLAGRRDDGTIPGHPYAKWTGAHWALVALADLGYPPGDAALVPLREQVLGWLFSREHLVGAVQKRTSGGLVRAHASFEGNAVYALLALGLADGRVEELVARLLTWQWPDGGWNCDLKPSARTSSFTETLVPLRGLARYDRETGDPRARRAVERAADVFLERRLFRRRATGTPIAASFTRLHYPCYWHYDVLFGLTVLDEAGFLADPRCRDALDLLAAKRLADGGFPAEERYYQTTRRDRSGYSPVDWGGTGVKRMNPFVTVQALAVLKRADDRHRESPPASRGAAPARSASPAPDRPPLSGAAPPRPAPRPSSASRCRG
jgi:hypothetical protein